MADELVSDDDTIKLANGRTLERRYAANLIGRSLAEYCEPGSDRQAYNLAHLAETLFAEVATLTAERDGLRDELDEERRINRSLMTDLEDADAAADRLRPVVETAEAERDALAVQLAQAELVVEAARTVLAAATAAKAAVPMDQHSPTSLAVLRQIIGPIIAVLSPALDALDGTAGPGEESGDGR